MTLRTSAYAAGAIGLILLIVGWVADSQRPSTEVTVSAAAGASVVVVEPDLVAVEQIQRIAITGTGAIEAHTARPIDVEEWLRGRTATFLEGIPTWEEGLTTRRATAPEPSASPSPSPSVDPSASPSPSPSPSATDTDADADAGTLDEAEITPTSGDHWRTTWRGEGRVSIAAGDVPVGETLVIRSVDGGALGQVELDVVREVNDGWITPLIWWGLALMVLAAVTALLALVDVRPIQRKGEEWMSERSKDGEAAPPQPGSRRARRLAGSAIPVASLDQEAGVASAVAFHPETSAADDPAAAEAVSDETTTVEEGPEDDRKSPMTDEEVTP